MKKANLMRACALAVIMLSTTSLAANAQTSRIYLAGYLGLNTFFDQEFTDSSSGNSGDFEIENDYSLAGALGLRLSPLVRLEGELSYRNADLSMADIQGVGSFDVGGKIKSTILFANAYYDFDVPWTIQPYIGGGLGYGWHSADIGDTSGFLTNASADETSIMWNVAAGVKYRTSPEMAFTAGYRYVDSFDLDVGSYEIDYDTHEFRLGMEWDLPIR